MLSSSVPVSVTSTCCPSFTPSVTLSADAALHAQRHAWFDHAVVSGVAGVGPVVQAGILAGHAAAVSRQAAPIAAVGLRDVPSPLRVLAERHARADDAEVVGDPVAGQAVQLPLCGRWFVGSGAEPTGVQQRVRAVDPAETQSPKRWQSQKLRIPPESGTASALISSKSTNRASAASSPATGTASASHSTA